MSKVKNWAWDCAEEAVDKLLDKFNKGMLTFKECEDEIMKVQNLELLGIDIYNVGELIEDSKE